MHFQNHLSQEQKQKIKQLSQMVKGNPLQMLSTITGGSSILGMLGTNNAEQLFYQKCKEMNLDPDEIISLLK